MSPRNRAGSKVEVLACCSFCGELPSRKTKRALKRAERQRWKKEIEKSPDIRA